MVLMVVTRLVGGDAAVVAEARPEGRAGAAIAACALVRRGSPRTLLAVIGRCGPVEIQASTPRAWPLRRIARCGPAHTVVVRYSFNASAGVLQPRVLRGRPFSVAATAARSSALCRVRSVPFGKYWRSSPLVFSLVPRCHGLCGSQKYTGRPVSIRSCGVLGHLRALIPGQRASQALGERCDRVGDRVADCLGAVPGERGTVLHPRAVVPAIGGR